VDVRALATRCFREAKNKDWVNEGEESTMIASKETLNGARMNAQVKLRVISLKRLELGSDSDGASG
jgi:hypothetical protein